MKNPPRFPQRPVSQALVLIGIMAVFIAAYLFWEPRPDARPKQPSPVEASKVVTTNHPPLTTGVGSATKSAGARAGVLPNWTTFQLRPLPVAYESTNFQWTLADGKATNVIQELAHNQLEYDRMVEENPRIFRRQLVYLKQTAAAVLEQAKLTGEPVRQLTLPGVDGLELPFEIVKSSNPGSSRQGMFSGHLAGDVNSLVTLAFQDGREAFTVISPQENIYVVGEPREDSQVIVKAIDPNTYGLGPAEAADHAPAVPSAK